MENSHRPAARSAAVALVTLLGSQSLVGLSVAGSPAVHPAASVSATFPMAATPGTAQIVHPTTSASFAMTATPPTGFVGNNAAWTATQPRYGVISMADNCASTSSTCTVTYTQQTPAYGQPDSFAVTLAGTVTDPATGQTTLESGSATLSVTNYASPPTANNFTVPDAGPAPVAVNLVTSENISFDGAVGASGVTITVTTPPDHGTATVAGTTITYQPNADFLTGSDTLGYTVAAGALQTASATMTVSEQSTNAGIPNDIVGQTQAAGAAELAAAGFAVTVTQQISAAIQVGRIITSQPAPGSAAPRGSAVKLIISQGPGPGASAPLSKIPGLTSEQVSVARGLENTCAALAGAFTSGTALTAKQQDLLTTCTAIISDYSAGSNLGGLQQTLNAISGRQATAAARIPMQFAAGQIANIGARLDALRSGERGISMSGLDLGVPGGARAAFTPLIDLTRGLLGGGAGDEPGSLLGDRLGIFVTGTLRRGSQDTTNAEQGFDFKNTGATVGADYRIGTSYILGAAFGYGKSESDFDDSGGRLDARHTSVSLYGSYFNDQFHIDWLAGFGHNAYDVARNIKFASSSTGIDCNGSVCSTSSEGSTGAREYSFSVSSALDFHRGAFAFGPTLELEYKQVGVNAFTESGPTGLDLQFGGMSSNSLLTKAGGYASYALNTHWFVVVPQIQVHVLHEFMNDSRSEGVQFAADTLPGAADRTFFVFTERPDRNYFDWKTSVLFQFPYGIAGFIDYGGIGGLRNINAHELSIGLRLTAGVH